MRSKAHIQGHPIHPMLIPFPFAFLTGAVIFNLAGRVRHRPRWWTIGGYLSAAGIGSALVAAVPGLIDYFAVVPPNSSGSSRATRHLLANVGGISLFTAGLRARGGMAAPPSVTTVAAELGGLVLLGIGGWLGGTLVYRNQIGVDIRYAGAGRWNEATIEPADGPVAVAARDELALNQMKLLHVGNRRIVLARTEDGHVAFADRCTHKGGPLAGGAMICATVQCPWHGSQFDVRTGQVRNGPASDPIETYRVQEDARTVYLLL